METPNDLERKIDRKRHIDVQGAQCYSVTVIKQATRDCEKVSIFIYINIYINIEVIFEGENVVQRTVTL